MKWIGSVCSVRGPNIFLLRFLGLDLEVGLKILTIELDVLVDRFFWNKFVSLNYSVNLNAELELKYCLSIHVMKPDHVGTIHMKWEYFKYFRRYVNIIFHSLFQKCGIFVISSFPMLIPCRKIREFILNIISFNETILV